MKEIMGKRYPEHPIAGVGALIVREKQVLLVQRKHPPGQGMWSLPGGVLELGEKLRHAVQREVEEETGLLVRTERLVQVLEMILPDEHEAIEYHYILFNYLCRVNGGALRAGSDAAQAAWFGWKEAVHERLWPDTRDLLKQTLKEVKD